MFNSQFLKSRESLSHLKQKIWKIIAKLFPSSIIIEVVAQTYSVKKVFLEISQNSQGSTCARVSFLIKLQASGVQLYLKRHSGTGVLLCILRNF